MVSVKQPKTGFSADTLLLEVASDHGHAAIVVRIERIGRHMFLDSSMARQAQMMDIANRQQQFLLANRAYATKTVLESSGYVLPSEVAGRYTYDVTVGTAAVPSFTLPFPPRGTQASVGALTLNSAGQKTPANKW